ncbi:yfjB [Wigglesworthia glossinidia endosymbiont of Glossina brevipalpis]|uniref:NAD kinase n=1 Tax=Wigglesworthia glossinidia brevipalpis TaxID=36870 RepID=NADK_WIGBR|nr:RecName: Full=NAD kinase; AltName: Full=ATP-dependent NAD kinase [Wigglesworthia glossinidia endosymbiont of Glossina brevipalpis]BAC24256.1 yfjB [Wigglesworthia glossinidia endosymbiont of Glossina brevipalpis]
MNYVFCIIGIIGYRLCLEQLSIYNNLYNWLIKKGYSVILENNIAQALNLNNVISGSTFDIGEKADLAIIIGGDGSMLRIAKILSNYPIKVIGINTGNLGFLTDLNPKSALSTLNYILNGNFYEEKRFLLNVITIKNNIKSKKHILNEVVVHSNNVAKMIEFKVYIDDVFSFFQRADGLIISTPTGSTAYSLSAGGPILMPLLNAIIIIPMFPHGLYSRPLVISAKSKIKIKFSKKILNLSISCDGTSPFKVYRNNEIVIKKSKKFLKLIHSNNYNYFNVLRKKLGWSKKFFKKIK